MREREVATLGGWVWGEAHEEGEAGERGSGGRSWCNSVVGEVSKGEEVALSDVAR